MKLKFRSKPYSDARVELTVTQDRYSFVYWETWRPKGKYPVAFPIDEFPTHNYDIYEHILNHLNPTNLDQLLGMQVFAEGALDAYKQFRRYIYNVAWMTVLNLGSDTESDPMQLSLF